MPNIIIKNEYGADETYENVDKVRFRMVGGSIASFSYNHGTIYDPTEPAVDTNGEFHVIFYDIEGNKLKEIYVDEGETVTPPTPPAYDSDYLEFDSWVSSGDYSNVTENIVAIAHYRVKDEWQWTRAQDGTVETDALVPTPDSFDETLTTTGAAQEKKIPVVFNWSSGGASTSALSCTFRCTYNAMDSFGRLYDSDGTTLLASNDDGGGDRKFLITYNCIAGKTYYLGLASYNYATTGRLYGTITGNSIAYSDWAYSYSTRGKVFLGNLYTYSSWKSLVTEEYDTIIFRCGKATADVGIPAWIKKVYYADTVEFASSASYKLCYLGASVKTLVLPSDISLAPSGVNCLNPNIRGYASIGLQTARAYFGAYKRDTKALVIDSNTVTIENYAFTDIFNLEVLVVPGSVTNIGAYAFANNNSLKELYIGSSVTSIASRAFSLYSPFIRKIVIPDAVTSIGVAAFRGLPRLKTLDIGNGITSIGQEGFYLENTIAAYYSASNIISDLYVRAVTPPTLGSNALYGRIGAGSKIHVPADSLSTYATASGWSAYSSYMVGDL